MERFLVLHMMNQENYHVQFVLNNIVSLLHCVSMHTIDIYIKRKACGKVRDFMLNALDYKYFILFLIVKLLKFTKILLLIVDETCQPIAN